MQETKGKKETKQGKKECLRKRKFQKVKARRGKGERVK